MGQNSTASTIMNRMKIAVSENNDVHYEEVVKLKIQKYGYVLRLGATKTRH